ncbi:hypothetical protein SLE2022_211700 [Rubroshorea leprosula]
MVHEYEGGWSTHLQDTLWAHRTSSRIAIGFLPYFLVYGYDVVLPNKVLVPTVHILAASELDNNVDICGQRQVENLESIEALCQITQEKAKKHPMNAKWLKSYYQTS